MKKYNTLLSLILIIVFSCKSQTKDKPKSNTTKKIETYLTNLEQTGFSGTVLVAKNGDITLSKGYGFSNREQQIKNDSKTIFDIGSVTKQFTAAAILKLEMQGKLSVNDKLSTYFNEVSDDKKDITLHHLLTHSSGLPSGIGDDYDPISTGAFITLALSRPLLFQSGTSYEYSNVGYSLLGIIIEKVSQQTYEQFLYQNLWQPAKMEQTGYTRPDFKSPIATGYRDTKNVGIPNDEKWDSDAPFWHLKANGGILSNIEDLYKWHVALLLNKVLSQKAKDKYFQPYIQEGDDAPSYYAYGWAIYTTSRNTKLAAHNGGNGIFFADFWRYLDDDMVIILLNNNATPYSQIIASQIGAITFSPTFKPRYPSEIDSEITDKQIDFLAQKVVRVLSKNDKKGWESFITNYGMKSFINMAPMNVHLDYFLKFHNELKDGILQDVNLEDDKLKVTVKSQNKIVILNLYVELNDNDELKFAGMRTEN
jgi:CubicO group peptidase (beta-lactamase class C family)